MMINKRLINLCNDSKKYIALTILSNWISFLCNVAIIFIIGSTINEIYLYKSISNSVFKVIIISVLLILRFICSTLYLKFSNFASSSARVKLRELIYKKLLRLGTRYSNYESTSAVVQVAGEGIEQLEVYFGKYLPQFFYSLLVPVTLFIFMSFISIKAAIVFILCVPLIPISIIAIMKIAKKILKDYWKSYSDLGGTFLENLQGLTTLKVFNVDEERHKKMNEEAENFRKITMKVLSMQLNSITIMDLVAFLGSALGSIVALIQYKNGQLQVGHLIIIILLSSEFFIPLRLLGSYFHIAMNGMAASDRIFNILDSKEREKKKSSFKNEEWSEVKVSFNNVSFNYDNERQILKDIDLDINNGGINAIVGESGSGKSTIASLILNKYDIQEGNIFINDIDARELDFDTIYNNISIVSTNSYIFNGTILENLLIAKKDATKEEIEAVLKKTRLFDFVSSLKDGLNSEVGQNGNKLSGGQKQRLALARTMLKDAPMIIFDEATSNIDVESEEIIWQTIDEISKDKTVLVISHRLANVRGAKKIYVINKGQIIEKGTHDELMEFKNHYFNMVMSQEELEKIREVS